MDTQPKFFTRLGSWLDTFFTRCLSHLHFSKRALAWMMPNGGTILIVLVLLVTQHAWAQSSQQIAGYPSATTVNYQGRLANKDGTPITQNDVLIKFGIYNAAEGGSLLWPAGGPETHQVDVVNGLFTVGLGSLTTGGVPTSLWTGDRYLEITIGDETLTPRELIRSVPVAGMALTVPDGAIKSRNITFSSYESYGKAHIVNDTTTMKPTGTKVTFTCDTNCVAEIEHRGLAMSTMANARVNVMVAVDGSRVFSELGYTNNEFAVLQGFGYVNLEPGQHTVEVLFQCPYLTTGANCTYYGDQSGWWDHLYVRLSAQP